MHAGQASTLPTERQFQPLSRGQLRQEQAVVPVLFFSGSHRVGRAARLAPQSPNQRSGALPALPRSLSVSLWLLT